MALILPESGVYRKQNFLSLKAGEDAGGAGVTITPNASANTKGSYSQLIASTSAASVWIMVQAKVNPVGTNTKSWLLDIATGAAASEVVVIPNLCISVAAQFNVQTVTLALPLKIPAGTRLSARCQSQTGTSPETLVCKAIVFGGDVTQIIGGNGIDSLNADTATSLGTAITPGSSGSESSYVQIIASTSREYRGIFGLIDTQATNDGGVTSVSTDIAIGGSGSESIIIPNHVIWVSGANLHDRTIPFLPIRIAAGTRIAARMAEAGTGVVHGLSLYGVY